MTLTAAPPVRLGTARGRWLLATAVIGSGMAFLDGTVVNVALRPIGTDTGASLGDLQWVVNGYLLSLAALIVIGGSLGDRFGRRRVFVIGVTWFGTASVLCGLAPGPLPLIAARVLQGIGAALLTPGSLAMISSSFAPTDRARAIGAWSGLAGVTTALGPLLGGWLVEYASWRFVFFINVPLTVLVVVVALRHVPETRDVEAAPHFDLVGAGLGAVGLAGVTYALIQAGTVSALTVTLAAVVGVAALATFVGVERRARIPMVPPSLFASRIFSTCNALTFVVYGALGALGFMLVLQLQVVAGYSPLQAGLATVPITVLMLLFSSRAGALAQRVGPRWLMTVGPLVAAVGTLALRGAGGGGSYWTAVFPGVAAFGVGLVLLVAPLTATVLAASPDRYAGIASGVNNAVARAGSLLAVAALPVAVGLSGRDYQDPAAFGAGYRAAMLVCAVLLALGGLFAAVGLRQTSPAT